MDEFRAFTSVAAAIFLEAMPFLALGSLLSALIEVLVPAERMLRLVPRRVPAGIALGAVAGIVVPTCECGVVAVARRLLRKGVPAHVAVAYLVSAPVLNPVVLASTWIAFQGSSTMLLARVAVALVVAAILGSVAWRTRSVLRDRTEAPAADACGQTHPSGRLGAVFVHAAHDFLDMGRFLVIGCLAAAAFKTFLPQDFFYALEGNAVPAIGGMMLLAVLLSVCSEADAFVAASFSGVPAAAKLAFVALGPVVDLKLIGMYARTFRRPVLVSLIVVPIVIVFVLSLVFHVVF